MADYRNLTLGSGLQDLYDSTYNNRAEIGGYGNQKGPGGYGYGQGMPPYPFQPPQGPQISQMPQMPSPMGPSRQMTPNPFPLGSPQNPMNPVAPQLQATPPFQMPQVPQMPAWNPGQITNAGGFRGGPVDPNYALIKQMTSPQAPPLQMPPVPSVPFQIPPPTGLPTPNPMIGKPDTGTNAGGFYGSKGYFENRGEPWRFTGYNM